MRDETLLQSVKRDLTEDSALFLYILDDLIKKLKDQNPIRPTLSPVVSAVQQNLLHIRSSVTTFSGDVSALTKMDDGDVLYEKKRQIIGDIHAAITLAGSAITSACWQSPAIDQSVIDRRGTPQGEILAHYNDYTRDQHHIGEVFEKKYRNEYIRVPRTIPVYTYVTSSGMAALTTAALLILGETPKDSPILMGTSCYFETKQLLLSLFGKRVIEVDLTDTVTRDQVISHYRPSAVFADTIGNEPGMRVVDIPSLLIAMRQSNAKERYVVADVSASSLMRPVLSRLSIPKGMMLIGVESQNKFLQFGFDRVTAGIVWGTGFAAMKLYDYRDHAGTIAGDTTVASLPTPNKTLALRYIKRLERNTRLMYESLNDNEKIIRKGVVVRYPDMQEFSGAYFMLSWKQHPLRSFDGYIKKVMTLAKKRNIALVHGTSFGFHTTRIYTVAMHTLYEKPFLRVAPGSETEPEIREISSLLIDAL